MTMPEGTEPARAAHAARDEAEPARAARAHAEPAGATTAPTKPTHTATTHTAPARTDPRNAIPSIRPALLGALSAEVVKLWTLLSNRILLAVAVLMIAAPGAMLSLATLTTLDDPRNAGRPAVITAMQLVDSVLWAQVIVAIVAVLAVTSEYTSGSIRLSLLALPTRLPWLAAKALVLAAAAYIVGVVGTVISFSVAALLLTGTEVTYDVAVGEATALTLGSGLYLAAIAALAVAIAAMLRNVIGALASVLALLVVLPPVLRSIPPIAVWSDFLPTIAGRRLISDLDSLLLLEPWVGFGVLAAWVTAALVASAVLLVRRDA